MTKAVGFFQPPPTNDTLRLIEVDLDGTLARSVWHPTITKSFIGEPVEEVVDAVNRAVVAGYTCFINTARPWADEDMIHAWLRLHEIPITRVQCGKVLVFASWDDKNVALGDIPAFAKALDIRSAA